MTPNNKWIFSGALALMVVAGTLPAQASIARAMTFEQKVQDADEIVVGRCTRSVSAFDSTGKWIVTYSTFAVEDELKGGTLGEVTIITPGGVVGSLRQETIGIPKFKEGDEKLLFTKSFDGQKTVLYADQGTYDVLGSGDARKIRPVSSKLLLVDPATGAMRSERETTRTLSDFNRSVHQILNRSESLNPAAVVHPKQQVVSESPKPSSNDFFRENGILLSMLALGLALAIIPLLRRR